jgi:hypothetical protein
VEIAVHDVGNYSESLLVGELVITVGPMIWVPERSLSSALRTQSW